MSDSNHGDWPEWVNVALAIAKWAMAAVGTVVSGAGVWIWRNYASHIAMLTKHEEFFRQDIDERGEQKAFRIESGKGPSGDKLNATIKELKDEDRKLHRRVNKTRQISAEALEEHEKKFAALMESHARVETDVKWLCKKFGQKESE